MLTHLFFFGGGGSNHFKLSEIFKTYIFSFSFLMFGNNFGIFINLTHRKIKDKYNNI